MTHPIRLLRMERNLTLDEAAKQLGTSKGNLSRIETGIHGASDSLKRRVADWSNGEITPNDLVSFVRDPAPAEAGSAA